MSEAVRALTGRPLPVQAPERVRADPAATREMRPHEAQFVEL